MKELIELDAALQGKTQPERIEILKKFAERCYRLGKNVSQYEEYIQHINH